MNPPPTSNDEASAPQFVAIGHVARDVLDAGTLPGGAAYYASRTAQALGLRAATWTSLGPDFPREALATVAVSAVPATNTTCFENRYDSTGRTQWLRAVAPPLEDTLVPEHLRSAPVIYLCPLMGEVSLTVAKQFPHALIGLGAQGWLRHAAADGRVSPKRWQLATEQLGPITFAVLSDEDTAGDRQIVQQLVRALPVVAYTHGARGCELFVAGDRHEVPAYPTTQVGPTGAGDVFGAGMLAGLFRGWEPLQAARLASCVASVVVEAAGGGALGRVGESWDRLAAYGKRYGVQVPKGPESPTADHTSLLR